MPYLTHDPIDVGEWRRLAADSREGAAVEFLGIVRGHEDGRPIAGLQYDAYEPMAQRMIAQLIECAHARWPLHRIEVRHRLGRVAVAEVAVLVGVWSAHRAEAFAACQFVIDAIKQDVPIWKSAIGSDGGIVEARHP